MSAHYLAAFLGAGFGAGFFLASSAAKRCFFFMGLLLS
jgi:hypothetical protein